MSLTFGEMFGRRFLPVLDRVDVSELKRILGHALSQAYFPVSPDDVWELWPTMFLKAGYTVEDAETGGEQTPPSGGYGRQANPL